MFDRAALTRLLRAQGIRPSSQRLAVAAAATERDDHPSADQVWHRARAALPEVSRATVYNTLNLLVAKGLLRQVELAGGRIVFDRNVGAHHHFIEDDTGRIYDIPWDALQVGNLEALDAYEIREYQVVLRGRRRRVPRSPHSNDSRNA